MSNTLIDVQDLFDYTDQTDTFRPCRFGHRLLISILIVIVMIHYKMLSYGRLYNNP